MEISLTKKQYETLIKVVECGYWVSLTDDNMEQTDEFMELEQYILSFANDFEIEGISFDAVGQVYELSKEQEQAVQQLINQYEDMVFWDRLAYEFALRDLQAEMAEKAYSEAEMFQRKVELEDYYHDYFEKNKLNKVFIEL